MRLIVFILSIAPILLCSQNEWELRKEDGDIKAFRRNVEASSFDEYRIEATIEGNVRQFTAVVQDMDIYTDIFDDTKKVTLVKEEGDHITELLIRTGTPFPFKDRYSYAKSVYSYDAPSKTLVMKIECLDNEYLRKVDGGIKVTKCGGGWKVKEIGDERISIVHYFHVEPEGVVPAWIVNKMTIESPIKSIKKIENYIKGGKHDGKQFDFIDN